MAIADRVKDTSASTGTGNFVLSGSAPSGFQALSAIGTVGATFGYVIDGGAEWEVGTGTITAANTFSRAPSASSNAGALVNFSAGTKTVFHDLIAAQILRLASADSALVTAIADTAVSTLLLEEGGAPKRITIANLLAAIGTTASGLDAAAGLSGSDIVTVTQGGVEKRTTLAAMAAFVASTLSTPASAITMSGPTSGTTGAASTNFTVGANGAITGTVVVTPSDSGAGGTFTPTTISISSGAPTGTFTYTPSTAGAKTISVTNNGSLTNPANITYTASAAAATAVTMSGPTTGAVSVASTNFTIAANGAITGTVVVTPSDAGGGGTFTPTTVSISSGTPSATFTYTPSATAGARTISVTNNGSLTNPSTITYTSTAGATSYTITGYAGSAPKTSLDGASPNGTHGSIKLWTNDATAGTNTPYWAFAPSLPASAVSGWGTSSTVAPATITKAQNQNAGSSINGMIPMAAGGSTYLVSEAYLWVPTGSGTSTWYFWVKPVDGVAQCMNAGAGTVVTGA